MSSAAKRAVVAGELHKIVKRYGVVDGKNRKIYKSYAVVGGVNRLIYMSENFAFSGTYAVSLVEIDSTKYDLYKLTTSGILSIYADDALFWMCGGGAGGVSATSAYSGAGGAGAFCTSGELSSGKYPVEIGKGGAADTDGAATTLGTYTAAGGKTGVGANGGNGGSGGGGGDRTTGSGGLKVGSGGTGDGVNKYPFGLTSLFAHCAGGGGGTNYYSQAAFVRGGEGGTNGGDGKNGNNPGTSLMYALGGEKGGGNGGQSGGWGSDASFYGSGGGGGGKATTSAYGKGGSGYQGVVYIAIPHKETIEPIVIIRQPQSQAAVIGDTVTLSVESTGVASYQWQYQKEGANWWGTLTDESATTEELTFVVTATRLTFKYRCKLTAADGTVVYTDVVTLTVTN